MKERRLKGETKLRVTEISTRRKETWKELCMDACWEADTFCPYLENHHGHQEYKGERRPNCNHAVHAPEISHVRWNSNHLNKYSHCQGVCMGVGLK